tara:strand:+ start:638 stop:931 length:294 start_codon:yes stop_codon:yes gene_type:complete
MAKKQIKFSDHAPEAKFQKVDEWERKMKPKRRNSFLTDLKYDTKRKLLRHREKLEKLQAQWEDADNYFAGYSFQHILDAIDETLSDLETMNVGRGEK